MSHLIFKPSVCLLLLFLCFSACKDSEVEVVQEPDYLFVPIPSSESGLDFSNTLIEDQDHNIINYIYYYNGGGVAVGDVNNDGLPDIYLVSNREQNKLFINQGNLKFKDVTESSKVGGSASWTTGASMVDINGDGQLDIYVCAVTGLLDFEGHNELFINNGDGTFSERAKEYGLDHKGFATQAYFFDYDKDDDLDLYIVNHAIHTTLSHGRADSRSKRVPSVGDVLLKNENGSFIDVSQEANIYGGVNGYGLSAAISDFNNDGWEDIYVCNDFHEDDYYYINNHDGTFSEQLGGSFSTIGRFSMGSDAADVNRDGYQDLITLDMLPNNEKAIKETEGDDAMFNMQKRLAELGYKDQYSRNMLQLNQKGSYFQEVALYNEIAATDWSWSPLISDFNNDGHQDVFITNGILRRPNGLDFIKYVSNAFNQSKTEKEAQNWLYNATGEMLSGVVPNEIFEGNSEKFSSRTGVWIEDLPQISNGAAYADLDLDGDLDLVLNNLGSTAKIYKNTTDGQSNYLSIKLDYKKNNFQGIGAKVEVFHGNITQTKHLFKSRGFQSSVNAILHFGLGSTDKVDSLRVIWPDNTYQMVQEVNINQELMVKYDHSPHEFNYENETTRTKKIQEENYFDYTHTEDIYEDFLVDKLLPYRLSTLGPAVAVGDVDGNGYEDVFLGAASGKRAKLFMNQGNFFTTAKIPEIEKDSLFEDNDAVLFDADGDNDLDLFVASGINTGRVNTLEQNRLYINENGIFKKNIENVPKSKLLGTTAIAYDYDLDGDQDLFLGNLADANDFGKPVSSYLLNNNGLGKFTIDGSFDLKGRVNDAIWYDVDNDGVKDLLIASEWDTPKILFNNNGKLIAQKLQNKLNGLWQSISCFDIDKDGDQDIVLGNWGTNTKFNLGFDGPLRMYHLDFDSNGKSETVMAYNKDGKYYPLHSKSELASQINAINKLFVFHKDYAGKAIHQILGNESLGKAKMYEVDVLKSGYLENNNGQFKFKGLPKEFQYAPITTINQISLNSETNSLFVGGNSTRTNSYHGYYTALKGLIVDDINSVDNLSDFGIAPINGQVKRVETIEMANKTLILIISNQDTIKMYSYLK